MSKNHIKSDTLHPYQKRLEEQTPEPIEWKRVDKSWILKFGCKKERDKLLKG